MKENPMRRTLYCFMIILMILPGWIGAQSYITPNGDMKIVVIKDPYSDSRTGPELLKGPGLLASGGLLEKLPEWGCSLEAILDVEMPPELEREYGEWNRASLTNRTLGKMMYAYDKGEVFFIGLLSGSKSVIGMLAGLQHLGPGRAPMKDSQGRDIIGLPRLGDAKPLKVGLVWIDAKAAFNTPDISVEGNMGGMNVAIAAGLSNSTLRMQAGLDPPISTKFIVMAGIRDTNPYEQFNIDNSFIETISINDLKHNSENIKKQMRRLSGLTDILYIHVDLSVLDPSEIPGHPHTVPHGPTSRELADCLETMFSFPRAAALGIASLHDEADEMSVKAAYRLIEGALKGIKNR